MQNSSLLSPAKTTSLTKTKFEFTNPRKNLHIVEDNFFRWSNDHMYRTSTHDMSQKVRKGFNFTTLLCRVLGVTIPCCVTSLRNKCDDYHQTILTTLFVEISREKESCSARLPRFRSRHVQLDPHWTALHRAYTRCFL